MNTTININLLGKSNVEAVLKNGSTAVHRFASDAVSSNKEVAQSSAQASSAISKIGSSASGSISTLSHMGTIGGHAAGTIHQGALQASHGLSAMGNEGGRAGEEITRSGETAKNALSRTGEAGRNAGHSISQGATTAARGVDTITKSAETANHGLGELSNLLGMIMGGVGVASIGNMLWTGATERQFNQAYLAMKLGDAQAQSMARSIEEIVAAVPGDDTFMNTLLGSAAARGAAISDLKELGYVAADYLIAAKKTGQTQIEAQQDLNAYIMTGTTGEVERSRVLAGQVDKLEGKKTIHERILALDEALKANGYEGMSQMDIMTIKAETFKGKIQVAATEMGSKILPYLEKGVDFLLELDEKTGGWSTQIGLATAGIVALALALGPVVWSAKEVLGSLGGVSDKLKGITSGKKKIDLECNPCPDDSQIGGSSGKSGKSSGSKSGGIRGSIGSIINTLGLSGVMAGTGEAVGVTGAASATLMGILGGATMTAGGYGLQSVGNWLKSTPEGQTGLGQFLSGNVANIAGLLNPIGAPFLSLGGSAAGSTNPYKINNPFNINFGQTLGQDWNRITGMFGSTGSNIGGQISNFGGMLGKLLPGTSSAAGGSSNKGINNDIFGKNGILDFSRFNIPNFKWPSPSQILNDIIDQVKPRIPGLKWQVPNVGQILGQTWDRINPLNWHIPGVGSLLGQTWDRINPLNWNIPGVGSLLGQTWEKISNLWWQVPGIGDILGLIGSRIGPFVWPMGPAQGPRGPGYTFLNSPPAGPIKNTIASTMAARSGVGSGYISSALDRNFAGVDAFNFIADGMAAPLHYQFYFGDQKSNQDVWNSGSCNCYDGAQFLMSEASQRFGLSAGLTNGVWDGTGIAHTWSNIGGRNFDMAAKLIRGQWNPPSGPGSFHDFMTDIGPGLEWRGYAGHQMDPVTALAQGGNCYDMSLGAMIVASQLYGKPSEMVWGTWDDQSHVWAKIDGREYDPLRRARDGTFTPPPQGPGNRIPGSLVVDVGGIHIYGDVHGVDDLNGRLNRAEKEAGENIAARIFSQFGG
ncbi:hypothetical protein [uncultured Methanobacterium sp.]|uniref:hypothetical protein n=1 Tax=uncultured Methanobacterium sp. TaxID=176306 RepID=UPI002AA8E595|nr:hypothetical protein [uncultured Methanobacterium sp.]